MGEVGGSPVGLNVASAGSEEESCPRVGSGCDCIVGSSKVGGGGGSDVGIGTAKEVGFEVGRDVPGELSCVGSLLDGCGLLLGLGVSGNSLG